MKKERIKIVYEDKYLLVVNKNENLLTVSTSKEKDKTLFSQVFDYIKMKNKNSKIFIVNRLDKETSGLVMFSKDERIKHTLQDNWDSLILKRGYVAVVSGVTPEFGEVKSYLKENKELISYSTRDTTGKLAITKYKRLTHNKRYSLLSIEIKTGRKNQIRVHMKDIGNSILGDKKYGETLLKSKRMYLIANELVFIHPVSKKEISLIIDIPNDFLELVK